MNAQSAETRTERPTAEHGLVDRRAGAAGRDHVARTRVLARDRIDPAAVLEDVAVDVGAAVGGGRAGDRHDRRRHGVERVEPAGRQELRLRRNRRRRERAHRLVGVHAAVAEILVATGMAREARRDEVGEEPDLHRRRRREREVAGEVDVVGGRGQHLLHLVGGERGAGHGMIRQQTAVDEVPRLAHDQRGDARAPTGRLRRARVRRDRDVDVVRAVVRAAVQEQVRVVLHERAVLGADRVHRDRVVVVGRVVVVVRLLVGRRRDDRHAAGVRVVDRVLSERRVVERAVRLLDHRRAAVDREDDAAREVVHVRDEAVAHLDRDERRVRRGADAPAVRRFGARVLGLARTVPVGDVVEGVVVVLVEVPARDVVDVAVAVGVGRVGEDGDQILRIDHAVAVRVADAAVLRVQPVGEVVADVEDAVRVPVVAVRGALRERQLGRVQVDLRREIAHGTRVPPLDAGVEDREHDVGPPGRHLPGLVDARPADAEELLGRRRHGRVDQAREAEVGGAQVGRDRRRIRRRQEEIRLEVGRVRAGRRERPAARRIRELGVCERGGGEDQRERQQRSFRHGGTPFERPRGATRRFGVLAPAEVGCKANCRAAPGSPERAGRRRALRGERRTGHVNRRASTHPPPAVDRRPPSARQ